MRRKIFSIILCLVICMTLSMVLVACGEPNITKIEVIGPSEIYEGEFDYSLYMLIVTYDDGNESSIALDSSMIAESEQSLLSLKGEHVIHITYKDQRITFELNVKAKSTEPPAPDKPNTPDTPDIPDAPTIRSISLSGPNDIVVGTFDYASYKLEVKYSDNSVKKVIFKDSMLSTADKAKLNKVGSHVITITYEGKTCDFAINVKDDETIKIIASIAVEGSPNVVVSTFHYADYKVVVTYDDGSVSRISLTENMVAEADRAKVNEVGTHRIHVTYMGVITTFSLTVNDMTVDIMSGRIEGPKRFARGHFDASALVLYLMYADGTSKEIPVIDSMISASDLAALQNVGNHYIGITYNGYTTKTMIEIYDDEDTSMGRFGLDAPTAEVVGNKIKPIDTAMRRDTSAIFLNAIDNFYLSDYSAVFERGRIETEVKINRVVQQTEAFRLHDGNDVFMYNNSYTAAGPSFVDIKVMEKYYIDGSKDTKPDDGIDEREYKILSTEKSSNVMISADERDPSKKIVKAACWPINEIYDNHDMYMTKYPNDPSRLNMYLLDDKTVIQSRKRPQLIEYKIKPDPEAPNDPNKWVYDLDVAGNKIPIDNPYYKFPIETKAKLALQGNENISYIRVMEYMLNQTLPGNVKMDAPMKLTFNVEVWPNGLFKRYVVTEGYSVKVSGIIDGEIELVNDARFLYDRTANPITKYYDASQGGFIHSARVLE